MDNGTKPQLDFICRYCGNTFKAPQGSRRQLCPFCLAKAIAKELPSKGEDNGKN